MDEPQIPGQLPIFEWAWKGDAADVEHGVLPCGCPREVNPEDECNGWHWAREEWDDHG